MKKIGIALFAFIASLPCALAADLAALDALFRETYYSRYSPRFCGRNIQSFFAEAKRRGIDLSGAQALRFRGGGFWETSGYYTRGFKNRRAMLGYFHIVALAEGHVFDFDFASDRAVPLVQYLRLQFTDPDATSAQRDPLDDLVKIKEDLPSWSVEGFDWTQAVSGHYLPRWKRRVDQWVHLPTVFESPRSECIPILAP